MSPLVPALLSATLTVSGPALARDPDPQGAGVWPLEPRPEVVHGFDPPDTSFGAGHRGVDLAGAPGQGVRAALGGQVTFAGRLAGRGVVVVSHGPTRTTYEPVRATASVGDLVDAGGAIGVLEAGGLSHCAPRLCLHWGWLRGEVYLDPLELVGAGPVRLLPLSGLAPVPAEGSSLSPGLRPARVATPLELAGGLAVLGRRAG